MTFLQWTGLIVIILFWFLGVIYSFFLLKWAILNCVAMIKGEPEPPDPMLLMWGWLWKRLRD
jgi:hypothetical protein